MKILLEVKQCPKCGTHCCRDQQAGPEKLFWCEECGTYIENMRR